MATARQHVSISRAEPEVYPSPDALAKAFGSSVLVPAWWPSDVGGIEYSLRRSRREYYQAASVRQDGAPICAIGWLEVPGRKSPQDWLSGEWFEPSGLSHVRGVIGRIGEPSRLQAVIYDHQLEIQLIGFATEDEILRAVDSLESAAP